MDGNPATGIGQQLREDSDCFLCNWRSGFRWLLEFPSPLTGINVRYRQKPKGLPGLSQLPLALPQNPMRRAAIGLPLLLAVCGPRLPAPNSADSRFDERDRAVPVLVSGLQPLPRMEAFVPIMFLP